MIDIHSHILHGIDDGAQSLDDSLEMARIAVRDGISTIVATPHGVEWGAGCNLSETAARVGMLQREVDKEGINLKIVPGLEVYLAPKLSQQLEDGIAFPINGSRYVLVEMPLHQFPIYTEQAIFELQLAGLTPIIAHPERNAGVQREPNLLYILIERGVLGQVTAASLCGDFGSQTKETAKILLQRNLVHVIATDAHSPHGHRAPVLSTGVAEAAKIIGVERAKAMVTDIPSAILEGRQIEVEPPIELIKHRSWAFWKR